MKGRGLHQIHSRVWEGLARQELEKICKQTLSLQKTSGESIYGLREALAGLGKIWHAELGENLQRRRVGRNAGNSGEMIFHKTRKWFVL